MRPAATLVRVRHRRVEIIQESRGARAEAVGVNGHAGEARRHRQLQTDMFWNGPAHHALSDDLSPARARPQPAKNGPPNVATTCLNGTTRAPFEAAALPCAG